MRVVLFAPTRVSLYSRLVARSVVEEPGLELVGIVVRSIWSLHRLRGELRRDGPRLLRKVSEKLINPASYPEKWEGPSLSRFALESGLPDKDLQKIAQTGGIAYLEPTDLNGPKTERALREWKPAVIAFTGGGLIRENILQIPNQGVLNCHAGLLPRFRGMDVVEWAILETESGDPPIGLTLHFMDRGVDTGPILLRHQEPVHPKDRLEAIRGRLEVHMVPMMMDGLRDLRDGSLEPQTQKLEDGRQYFMIHPRLHQAAKDRLTAITSP